MSTIADIRKDYSLLALDEAGLHKDTIQRFEKCRKNALVSEIEVVNAMTFDYKHCR